MTAESRISSLAIPLERSNPPAGKFTYIPARRSGNLVFISGQLPRKQLDDGSLAIMKGKVGFEVSTDHAKDAARLCGISILSVLRDTIGNLDKVTAVIKVEGFVNATDSFTEHPHVINGCSDLFVEVFGTEIGSHARAAVGCVSLPLGASVEVAAIFEVRD